jgi:hypothetical protein
MRPSPIRAAAVAAILLVTLVACSDDGTAPASGTVSPAVELLDFEAPTLDGSTFRGAELAGTDVAFWFWAPW